MKISIPFSAIVLAALVYWVTAGDGLMVYYALLNLVVVIAMLLTRVSDLWWLGVILVLRFILENATYPVWTPIEWLLIGHLFLGSCAFVLAFNRKELWWFPVLILAQGFSEGAFLLGLEKFIYENIHNVLGIIQITLYPVVVWEMKKITSRMGVIESLMMSIRHRFSSYMKTITN